MPNKFMAICLSVVLLVLLVFAGCASKPGVTAEQSSVKRLSMLFDSPLADDAFSLACLRGAEKAKGEFGIRLTVSEAGSDAEAGYLLGQIAESESYDLIICIGASQTAALKLTAAKYPQQKFALVDGDVGDLSNVASLLTRDNESSFLAGALAAMVTKTNILGFVGGREQESIQRFLAGYQAGAQSIQPDCQLLVDYAGSWLNDGVSRSLALAQITRGADVLFGPAGAGSLGVIEAAREKGLFAIGVDNDQSPVAPETVLISAVKHVDVSVYGTIRAVVENQFKGGIQTGGLKEGAVEAKINAAIQIITPDMQSRIDALNNQIQAGEIEVPER